MKKKLFFSLLMFMTVAFSSFAQVDKIVGRWKTIDDKDGSEKSIILIYKQPTVTEKLLKATETVCKTCEGENKQTLSPEWLLFRD